MTPRFESSDIGYKVVDCGLTRYRENYELQKRIFSRRLEGSGEDVLLITRHEPVITLGKSAREKDLLVSKDFLSDNGVELVELDRGGGITYHGPGQLVVYPIFDLRGYGKDLRRFIKKLGSAASRTVEELGLNVEFKEGNKIGLWVKGDETRKLGSLGLRVKKWYTMHGLALNVSLDKEKAGLIRPCGVEGATLVSLEDFVDTKLEEVKKILLTQLNEEFSGGGSM